MGEFHATSRQKNLSFLKNDIKHEFFEIIYKSFLKNIHRIHIHAARDILGGF